MGVGVGILGPLTGKTFGDLGGQRGIQKGLKREGFPNGPRTPKIGFRAQIP